MDVLILTGEPLPLPGHVTTGAGLRAWGLAQGLRSAGLDAWIATRRMAMVSVSEDQARAHRAMLWEPESIASLIERADPHCVVSQHWGLLRDVPPLTRPLAIDLAGPHLLERRLWGAENWAEHLEEKLEALRRADFVVCSGERQRLYFLNHLALAGFGLAEDTLPVIPFSVSPDLPSATHAPDQFVYGGMFLPWQDPRSALETLVETLEAEGHGHLQFWGGPHPRLDVSRGRFEGLMDRLERSPRVACHGLTAFDAYIDAISRCGVALDLMARNPERELAFATRTVVYLWAGLPVIHGDFDELAPLIAEADAGWILAPGDTDSLKAVIHQILSSPDIVAEKSAHAQQLVCARLTWDKTIAPLAAWCREPRRREARLAVSLAFESKDREIERLRGERDRAQSELLTHRGKISWRIAEAILSMRWLWAALIWIVLLPACLLIGLLLFLLDLLPRQAGARTFPPPPGKPGDRATAQSGDGAIGRPPGAPPGRGLLLSLILWVVVYMGLSLLTAALPAQAFGNVGSGPGSLYVLPLFAALALVVTTLWVIYSGVTCGWSRPALLVGTVVCVGISLAVHSVAGPKAGHSLWTVTLFGVANVAVLGAALCIGKLIGLGIERASWVLPICLVAIAVDCWSVYFGPTGHVAREAVTNPVGAETAHRFMIWYPNLTPISAEGLAVQPAFGIADFIIAALLLEAGRRFGLGLIRSLVAMIVGLLAALIASTYSESGVPALPFLAIAFLAVNWTRIQVSRREIAICAAFILGLLLVLIFVVNPLVAVARSGVSP